MKKVYLQTKPSNPLKTLLAGILLAAGMTAAAQPSLEHTYTVSTSICSLEKAGEMYFAMDVTNKQCRIYDLDHNLYRTISLAVPADHYSEPVPIFHSQLTV